MTELIESITSWRSLLFALAVFGFAPGFVLRLLVRIYPKEDPRRTELISELYGLGHVKRLLFVAEQLETVLFEGAPHRLKEILDSVRSSNQSDQHSDPGTPQDSGGHDRVTARDSSLYRVHPSRPLGVRSPLHRIWHNAGLRIAGSSTVHAIRITPRPDGGERVSPACHTGHARADVSDKLAPVYHQAVNCQNCWTYRMPQQHGRPYDPNSNQLVLPGMPLMPSWPSP